MSRYFVREPYQQIELKKYIANLESDMEICNNEISKLHRLHQNSMIFYSEYQEKLHELASKLIILTRNYTDIMYLYECLGDITISLEAIKMYYELFHTIGLYSNYREQKEAVCTLYNIICRFTMLSIHAIKEISLVYNSEFFNQEKLIDKLSLVVQENDKNDEIFINFINDTIVKRRILNNL